MNKLIRKLTLSGVTLGVAALSLTTSTYAWFTTNTQATASGVSGTVEASGGNMLIKTLNYWQGDTIKDTTDTTETETWSDFASTVNLHAKDKVKMNPVTYGSVTTNGNGASTTTYGFYKGTDGGTAFTTAAGETDYLHYKIIFALSSLATSSDITNKVTMKVDNFTASSEGSQYLLVDASSSIDTSGAKAGDTIKVNLLDVLSMRVESTIITKGSNEDSVYGIQVSDLTATDSNLTSNNACYRYRDESEKVTVNGSTTAKDADALTYYNTVHGISASRPGKDTDRGYLDSTTSPKTLVSSSNGTETANEITLFTVSGTTKAYVMCDIYFYIDGWDKQCFNAAGGLSLAQGNLEFKLNPNNN